MSHSASNKSRSLFRFLLAPLLSKGKGWLGEFGIRNVVLRLLDKEHYSVLNDLYLLRPDGQGTTQIDHVVLSKYGIFVIETKNYKGKIYGSLKSPRWQQWVGGYKNGFQNPVQQNQLHVKALAKELDLPLESFHNLVFFVGSAELKGKDWPETVTDRGFYPVIKNFRERLLDDAVLERARQHLDVLVSKTNRKQVKREHVDSLKKRHSRKAVEKKVPVAETKDAGLTEEPPCEAAEVCKLCGSGMILRTTKSGKNAGRRFWGCSTFPSCRSTVALPPVS